MLPDYRLALPLGEHLMFIINSNSLAYGTAHSHLFTTTARRGALEFRLPVLSLQTDYSRKGHFLVGIIVYLRII